MHCNYDCLNCARPDCDCKAADFSRSEYLLRVAGRYPENSRIRSARQAAGMTLSELANRVHRAVSTVHHWELGRFRADWPALARALPGLVPPEEREENHE